MSGATYRIDPLSDGRGGYLCPICGYGPFRTAARAAAFCPNLGGRNHPEPPRFNLQGERIR